jgi:hypothetical protein
MYYCSVPINTPSLVVRMGAGNFSKGITDLVLLFLSVSINTPSLAVRMKAGNFSKGITELGLKGLEVLTALVPGEDRGTGRYI